MQIPIVSNLALFVVSAHAKIKLFAGAHTQTICNCQQLLSPPEFFVSQIKKFTIIQRDGSTKQPATSTGHSGHHLLFLPLLLLFFRRRRRHHHRRQPIGRGSKPQSHQEEEAKSSRLQSRQAS